MRVFPPLKIAATTEAPATQSRPWRWLTCRGHDPPARPQRTSPARMWRGSVVSSASSRGRHAIVLNSVAITLAEDLIKEEFVVVKVVNMERGQDEVDGFAVGAGHDERARPETQGRLVHGPPVVFPTGHLHNSIERQRPPCIHYRRRCRRLQGRIQCRSRTWLPLSKLEPPALISPVLVLVLSPDPSLVKPLFILPQPLRTKSNVLVVDLQ